MHGAHPSLCFGRVRAAVCPDQASLSALITQAFSPIQFAQIVTPLTYAVLSTILRQDVRKFSTPCVSKPSLSSFRLAGSVSAWHCRRARRLCNARALTQRCRLCLLPCSCRTANSSRLPTCARTSTCGGERVCFLASHGVHCREP
jgi:hypothetical protein